jgi:hypothetical protein
LCNDGGEVCAGVAGTEGVYSSDDDTTELEKVYYSRLIHSYTRLIHSYTRLIHSYTRLIHSYTRLID